MIDQIYFDSEELRRGNFFELSSRKLTTKEGNLYELGDYIDRGGNAAVFRCRDRVTGEERAVKFLMNHGWRNTKRFLREMKLLELVEEDHTPKYYGSGRVTVTDNKSKSTRNIPFMIMELTDCNLQELMTAESRALSYERYAGQFRGLAKALASLHDYAVHRDIKPENVLVAGDRWLLSDYGLCTFVNPDEEDLTGDVQNVGPKFWLSPEAHNRRLRCGDEIGPASDVFQLAAIFWYVATGRHPSGIVTEDDWTGPRKLFHLLHRSLFHDCTKRPQNGSEFFRDLADALSQ